MAPGDQLPQTRQRVPPPTTQGDFNLEQQPLRDTWSTTRAKESSEPSLGSTATRSGSQSSTSAAHTVAPPEPRRRNHSYASRGHAALPQGPPAEFQSAPVDVLGPGPGPGSPAPGPSLGSPPPPRPRPTPNPDINRAQVHPAWDERTVQLMRNSCRVQAHFGTTPAATQGTKRVNEIRRISIVPSARATAALRPMLFLRFSLGHPRSLFGFLA